jgi:DNA invertase Pin-like site-specific DNA recombinase
MAKNNKITRPNPQPGWAVYLRTSSEDHQKPEMSRARQRFAIDAAVLDRSDIPVYREYIDVLTGQSPARPGYQEMLRDARAGKFSHVVVERADRFGRNDVEALRAIDELHEYGVRVVFANTPDIDAQDPDERVLVALTFTMAQRESKLLALRVRGGHRAKVEGGGYPTLAPDGYKNIDVRNEGLERHQQGRFSKIMVVDEERAPIWRYAWDLLLTDKYTLDEICEKLHERGYTHRSGRPFITINAKGVRKANKSTLFNIFHNWAYAGWLVSEQYDIPPLTKRGNWEPIVTTEEFEKGVEILNRRTHKRTYKRDHQYLLRGLVYYQADGDLRRLSCSTSNANRARGSTSYYCIARSNINLKCDDIDAHIPLALSRVAVAPEYVPLIREAYTSEIKRRQTNVPANERERLEQALKAVKEEEARGTRLYTTGKIDDDLWNELWQDWRDRRRKIESTLASLEVDYEEKVENLDAALNILSQVAGLYENMTFDERLDLVRLMIEKVIVNEERQVRVFFKPPFDYLEETIRGVFKKHAEPRKIVIIAPKDKHSSTGQRGHRSLVHDTHRKNYNIWI